MKLAVRTFAYARIGAGSGLLSRSWRSVMRLIAAEDLLPARDAVPPSLRAYLLPREQPVIVGRAHPAVLLPHLAVLLFGTIAAVALSFAFLRFLAMVIIWSVWILLLGNLIRAAGDWSARYILLTDERLLAVRGFGSDSNGCEEVTGAFPECGGGLLALIAEDLGVGHSGMVVDGVMEVGAAAASSGVVLGALLSPECTVATSVGDTAKFLDVDVY